MAKYPCSKCKQQADTATGCPNCGQTLEEEIRALDGTITSMQRRNRAIAEDRSALMARLQGAIAIRSLLQRASGQQGGAIPAPTSRIGRIGTPRTPLEIPVKAPRRARRARMPRQATPSGGTVGEAPPNPKAAPGTAGGAGVPRQGATTPRPSTSTPRAVPRGRIVPPSGTRTGPPRQSGGTTTRPGPAGHTSHHPQHPPETTAQSAQNIVLGLGALVLAIAVGLLPFIYTNWNDGLRAAILVAVTLAAIAAPVVLARMRYLTTSEWIAPIGLLMILLDGDELWSAQISHTSLSGTTYAGFVAMAAAGVASGYQRVTGLSVPKFASILLLQPVPALLVFPLLTDVPGWAAVVTLTAAVDLGIAYWMSESGKNGKALLNAVMWLQEAVTAAAIVLGGYALYHAHGAAASIRTGGSVVAAAIIALAAGLLFNRKRRQEIAAGVATLAFIGGFGRMASLLVPGWGLTAAALAILGTAIGVALLPPAARRGARIAGATTTVVLTVIVIVRARTTIAAPVRAATPWWRADIAGYDRFIAAHAGHGTGQLVTSILLVAAATAILVTRAWRRDSLVIGVALASIVAPGAWQLPWALAVAEGTFVALLLGAVALTALTTRESWTGIAAAFATGVYPVLLSLARPGAEALVLAWLVVGGALVGRIGERGPGARAIVAWLRGIPAVAFISRRNAAAPTKRVRTVQPHVRPSVRVADAGWGAAAFAFPGAVAAAIAALSPIGAVNRLAVMSAGLVAVTGTLAAAAIAQVARARRPERPAAGNPETRLLVAGAGLGAAVVAIAVLRMPGSVPMDHVVAFALLVSAALMNAAPLTSTGYRTVGASRWRLVTLDSDELAAAAVAATTIVTLARVTSLLAPGIGLFVMAALVLVVAIGTRSLPEQWRRGPVRGAGIVGIGIAAVAGTAAFNVAYTAIRINKPVWGVRLPGWAGRLAADTMPVAHGPQAALALILLGVAAAIVLTPPGSHVAIAVSGGLTALILPATLGTSWWGPALFSGLGAVVAGIAAAASRDRITSLARGGVATLLFANTIAASLVQPGTTAATLVMSAVVCFIVANVAAVTASGQAVWWDRSRATPPRPDEEADVSHLELLGGGALGGAVLVLAAGGATIAAATGQTYMTILTAAMAGVAASLAAIAVRAKPLEPLLSQASGAISLTATGVAFAAISDFTEAGVFASIAALLAVLAELLRASVKNATAGRWLPQRTTVMLAAGPATVLATATVALTTFAALTGPYHWIGSVWTGAPATSLGELGAAAHLVGSPVGVITALVLTVMAMVGSIGFGGSRETVVGRTVAVVTPGLAIALLIAPFLLRTPWPGGVVTAIAVAAISGLALALSVEPAESVPTSALRAARRLVAVICALSAGAGMSGALADRTATVVALGVATVTGGVAAWWGRTQSARVTGWIVAGAGAELFALVASLAGGLAPDGAAFAVGGVAAGLLILTSLQPRMRAPEFLVENITLEVIAYSGGVLALVLSAGSVAHLALFFAAWGSVLGVAVARSERPALYRSVLLWAAAAHELAAWCLLMFFSHIALTEAYTLGFAAIAYVTGWIERRWHPAQSSWITYGIALSAALGPSLAIVIATGETPLRRGLLLVGAAAVVLAGVKPRQAAMLIIGGVALLGAAINEVARYSTTVLLLVLMALIAGVLLAVGASSEKRRLARQNVSPPTAPPAETPAEPAPRTPARG